MKAKKKTYYLRIKGIEGEGKDYEDTVVAPSREYAIQSFLDAPQLALSGFTRDMITPHIKEELYSKTLLNKLEENWG